MSDSFASCFFSLQPEQFALLAALLGILLVEDLDLDQQNSLGNFFVSLGSTMLAAAAQGSLLQSNSTRNDPLQKQIEELKKQIRALEQKMD